MFAVYLDFIKVFALIILLMGQLFSILYNGKCIKFNYTHTHTHTHIYIYIYIYIYRVSQNV